MNIEKRNMANNSFKAVTPIFTKVFKGYGHKPITPQIPKIDKPSLKLIKKGL